MRGGVALRSIGSVAEGQGGKVGRQVAHAMSLFRTKEWWRSADTRGQGGLEQDVREECDAQAFCVGNLDNDPRGGTKIATGTLGGVLRIYAPKGPAPSPDDLLLEVEMDGPIIQLCAACLSPDYDQCLAVLQPRCLTAYALLREAPAQASTTAPSASFTQVALQKLYEHKLERTAANVVCGAFGRGGGRSAGGHYAPESMCVQSVDGQLSVFEGSTFAFSRFLSPFLLPGPLRYCKVSDAFYTCSSGFEIECYRYQTLASATQSATTEDAGRMARDSSGSAGQASGRGLPPPLLQNGNPNAGPGSSTFKHGKRLQPDWRYNLGEGAVDIKFGKFTRSSSKSRTDVAVLGERSLFIFTDAGEMHSLRKLSFAPLCLACYRSKANDQQATDNLIVGTSTGYVMVYNTERLIWSAKHEIVPIAMGVASAGKVPGLIMSFGEDATVLISYLGADPPTQVVSGAEGKALNYEEMESEHRQLLNVIRQRANEQPPEPLDQLMLRAQIPRYMQRTGGEGGDDSMEPGMSAGNGMDGGSDQGDGVGRAICGKVYLSYTGTGTLHDVTLSMEVPAPLEVEPRTLTVPTIAGSAGRATPVTVPIVLYPGSYSLPVDRTLVITASYQTFTGESRTAKCECELPMCLFGVVVPPSKHASHKIVLGTNRNPPQLLDLFEDVFRSSQEYGYADVDYNNAPNVMSFKYFSGEIVTAVVSKSAGRFRIQSDDFGAMWLIVDELAQRLEAYYQGEDDGGVAGGGERGEGEGGRLDIPAAQRPCPLGTRSRARGACSAWTSPSPAGTTAPRQSSE